MSRMVKQKVPLVQSLDALQLLGWTVKRPAKSSQIPPAIVDRYGWLPLEVRNAVEAYEEICSGDQTAWLVTVDDFCGNSPCAYAWNEWELMSLDAASGDRELEDRIRQFWNQHFPVMMSVKSGYAYFAIAKESLAVVVGEEPEFEEVSPVAASLREFLAMIAAGDRRLARWIG